MPELETEIEEPKGLEVEQDDAGAGEPEKSADAESSTAKDVSKPVEGDSLSIVRDVVAKGKKDPEAAASSATAEADPDAGAKATKEPKERDDENFSDAPFNKHPRFKELIAQRNEFRTDAQRYRNVQAFIDQNSLSAEETADLIVIGGLMKTNPAEAWKRMKPVVEQVLRAAGEVLPEDLSAMVQNGEMTREAALQVSRSRASVSSMEAAQRWEQQRQQTAEQQRQQQAIQGAVSSWEAERQARDPNFAAKLTALQQEVRRLQDNGWKPNTPEGVKAQLDTAYGTVNQTFAPPQARPQKQPIRPVAGGQVNGNARPEVKSALDAVNAVIARRAG